VRGHTVSLGLLSWNLQASALGVGRVGRISLDSLLNLLVVGCGEAPVVALTVELKLTLTLRRILKSVQGR
jgi:hypothetical protein